MKRATLWTVLAVLCIILLPKAAFAHAYIVKSTPAENQELKKAPAKIKIEFNEAIQNGFHSITVRNSSGERVDSGKTEIDPQNAKIMTVMLKPKLKDDIYSAEWRAVSADGHPVSGTIPFSIGNIQGGLPKDQQKQASGLPAADTVMARVLLYTGFSLFMGAALFQLVWYRPENGWPGGKRRRLKRIKNAALLLTGAAIIIQLPLQTKVNAGVSWIGAFQPSLLQETLLNTTGGMLWLINIAIIALLVFCSNRKGLKSAILSLFLFAGLLFVKSLDGHAASTSAGYMTIAMNFIHLNTASIWTGGLAMFVLFFGKDWLKPDKSLIWETIRRFSPWALASAGLLIFSGLFNSFFIVHTLDNLLGTAYGKALLVKAALLVTTAVFTNIPSPPAPLPQPFSETKQLTEGNTLSLRISPNMPGSNAFEVTVRNRKGDVVKDIQKIELTVEKTGLFGDDKESTFSLSKNKDGVFQTKNLNLSEDGIWKIRVHGLTASFEEIRTVFNAKINKKEF